MPVNTCTGDAKSLSVFANMVLSSAPHRTSLYLMGISVVIVGVSSWR